MRIAVVAFALIATAASSVAAADRGRTDGPRVVGRSLGSSARLERTRLGPLRRLSDRRLGRVRRPEETPQTRVRPSSRVERERTPVRPAVRKGYYRRWRRF